MKSFLRQFVAWALALTFMSQSLSSASIRSQGKATTTQESSPPVVEHLLGNWKNEQDGSVITIESLYLNDPARKNELKLSGKYDWGGTYQGGVLSFRRSPNFEEMNKAIPEWARKKVEGQLYWTLQLTVVECGGLPVMNGKWYPGEVVWREEKDRQNGQVIKQEASMAGPGEPRELDYTKPELTGRADDEQWVEQPSIVVRSAIRPVPDRVLDSVYRTEPFHVEVRMSREQAAKTGPIVDVSFRAMSSGATSTLRLSSSGVRPVVYSAPGPVTLRNGGEGAGRTTTLDYLLPSGATVMAPLDVVNNEMVEVSLSNSGSKAQFRAHVHPVQQAVARVAASLNDRRALYEFILREPQIAGADREVARTKIRLVTNAQRIMNLMERTRPKLTIFGDAPKQITLDHQEFMVGAEYLKLLDDPANWVGSKFPLFPSVAPPSRDSRFTGVIYYSPLERPLVDQALERGSQLFFDQTAKTLRQTSSDLLLFALSTTTASQFVILIFGISPTGERVDMTERVLAGISLGAQALLSGALAARRYQSLLKEAEAAARQFEREVLLAVRTETSTNVPTLAGSLVSIAARRTQVIGAEVDLARVATPVGSETTLPGAKLFPGRRYLLQEFDDTCGPTVGEQFRRTWGLPPRTERETMLVSYSRGKAYRAGEGMSTKGLARFLEAEKAAVRMPKGVSLAQIELQLIKGRQVAVMINTSPKGVKPFYHWVEPQEIIHKRGGKHSVVFGDPWNGNVWEVDSCVFWDQMNRNEVVFAKWK